MDDGKRTLLGWIAQDEKRLVESLSAFVRAKSPNPPGDTREAAAHVCGLLEGEGLAHRVIAPKPEFPNVVASFDGEEEGRHLVLNGHIDVFPVGEHERWRYGAWSGEVAEGAVWGRGAADMKCGTTASIFTYVYLHRLRERLRGRLTLTAVSDEENFGPWGARYLMEHHLEVHGDCCLNGEPISPLSVRFGEKGPLWLEFTVSTTGAHGAYVHLSESATKIAAALVADLESLTEIDSPAPGNVAAVLERGSDAVDAALGEGASRIVQKVTVNIGSIRGGLKVNIVPSECVVEADIRLPVGLGKEPVLAGVREILANYPQVRMREMNFSPPNWCDPEHEMVGIIQRNAQALRGITPEPVCSLGGTDTRLWRFADVPAYVYGPYPTVMGAGDEHVPIEDFLHVVRTHVLSAYDYLRR